MNQRMPTTFALLLAISIVPSAWAMAQMYSGSVSAVNPMGNLSGLSGVSISRMHNSMTLPSMASMDLNGSLGKINIQMLKKAQGVSAPVPVQVVASRFPRASEPGHELGSVTGTNIEMKVYDHAVAGAINGSVAWGFFNEATASSQLLLRKYGQAITTEFKKQADGSLGGVITSGEGASLRTTSVFFAGADPAAKTFKLLINGETVTVTITPEGISNGHYVNPTYSTVINGKPVSYRIEAEGCMGYSIQMGMIILGAYAH